MVVVEAEERRGNPATCTHTSRRRAERDTGAPPLRWRTPWTKQHEHQAEEVKASPETTPIGALSQHIGTYPQPNGYGGFHGRRRENAKLAVDNAWPGMRKMEHLINFLSHSHACPPWLGGDSSNRPAWPRVHVHARLVHRCHDVGTGWPGDCVRQLS